MKEVLKRTLMELASKCRKYHEFERSLEIIKITKEQLHEIGIKYIVTHETDTGTAYFFFNDEIEAKEAMRKWYENHLIKTLKYDNFISEDGTHATVIYRVSPYNDVDHFFAVHTI